LPITQMFSTDHLAILPQLNIAICLQLIIFLGFHVVRAYECRCSF
jgi:hypothetical protein